MIRGVRENESKAFCSCQELLYDFLQKLQDVIKLTRNKTGHDIRPRTAWEIEAFRITMKHHRQLSPSLHCFPWISAANPTAVQSTVQQSCLCSSKPPPSAPKTFRQTHKIDPDNFSICRFGDSPDQRAIGWGENRRGRLFPQVKIIVALFSRSQRE